LLPSASASGKASRFRPEGSLVVCARFVCASLFASLGVIPPDLGRRLRANVEVRVLSRPIMRHPAMRTSAAGQNFRQAVETRPVNFDSRAHISVGVWANKHDFRHDDLPFPGIRRGFFVTGGVESPKDFKMPLITMSRGGNFVGKDPDAAIELTAAASSQPPLFFRSLSHR
jgi:hypothetical protein